MAHGLECVKCGYQETPHLHPEYLAEGQKTCGHFRDGIRHSKECPRTGCAGNCKKTIADQNWAAIAAEHHASNMLAVVTDKRGNKHLVMLDMGS